MELFSAEDLLWANSQPDPECYALVFRRLSRVHPSRVKVPERSFAIEDTAAGIRSAKGAGLRVLA